MALESEPGDVVILTESLWHASFGGKAGRRMFTLNYLAQPTTAEHVESVRRWYEMNLRYMKEQQFSPRDWIYGEAFAAVTDLRCRRRQSTRKTKIPHLDKRKTSLEPDAMRAKPESTDAERPWGWNKG